MTFKIIFKLAKKEGVAEHRKTLEIEKDIILGKIQLNIWSTEQQYYIFQIQIMQVSATTVLTDGGGGGMIFT